VSTIAVTGSASGMGAATRALLLEAGHRVIGVDLRDADIIADLATSEGRAGAVDKVAAACGGVLDGAATFAGVMGLPGRDGSLVASVNYFGTVEVMAGLRPLLAASRDSSAVCISSNSTTCQPKIPTELVEACLAGDEQLVRRLADGSGAIATYAASKLAVAWWVRAQATQADWIGAGIRLNAVAPGYVATPMTAEGMRDPAMAKMLEQFPVPVGRPGRAEEIGALVAFLLGDDARFFCGSVLFCDGGSDALFRAKDYPSIW
jgi:NAD(P)-dependent dehydrogenase (short-subunit alcohol dehydrogenase family)